MKTLLLTSASIALLVCCLGCPSGDGGSDNAKPVANKLTDNSGNASSDEAAKPADADVVISEGVFDVAGVKLGMTYEDWQEFYPEESGALLESTWATDGEVGLVSAIPSDPDLAPIDSGWFYSGKLVGFNSDFNMSLEDFTARVATVEKKYGEALAVPPTWVVETPFFAGYQDPPPQIVQRFWVDEDEREVMMSFHIDEESFGTFSLINVDLLDGRIEEAVMGKMSAGNEAALAGEENNMDVPAGAVEDAVQVELEPVPADKFGYDGVYLGADANLLKARFEMRGLTSMGMWVDRDWTGRMDGNPINGAALPSEVGWLLDGGLVGFMTTVAGSDSAYLAAIANLTEVYGEPLTEVPGWANDSDFFSGYDFQGNEEGVEIWVDEVNRGMMFLTFEPLDESITTMLVNVDNYREALETTSEAVEGQGHSQ